MHNIKKELKSGLREGWALFWSPFVGMYCAAIAILFTRSAPTSTRGSFSAGLKEAWTLFWSPFRAFYKAAKAIFEN